MFNVDLSSLESDFFGIIIPSRTGYIWTTQAGGTACFHPELEGVFIPLDGGPRDGAGVDDPLYDRVEPYDVGRVWNFLNAHQLNDDFAPIKLEEMLKDVLSIGTDASPAERPNRLFEAWVPVLIVAPNEYRLPQLTPLRGVWGVLIYPNSD